MQKNHSSFVGVFSCFWQPVSAARTCPHTKLHDPGGLRVPAGRSLSDVAPAGPYAAFACFEAKFKFIISSKTALNPEYCSKKVKAINQKHSWCFIFIYKSLDWYFNMFMTRIVRIVTSRWWAPSPSADSHWLWPECPIFQTQSEQVSSTERGTDSLTVTKTQHGICNIQKKPLEWRRPDRSVN